MEAIRQVYQWSTITHNFKVHTISLLFRIIILCLLIVVVPFTVNLFSLIHLLNYLNYIKFLNFLLQSLHCDWFKKLTPLSQPIETFSMSIATPFLRLVVVITLVFNWKEILNKSFLCLVLNSIQCRKLGNLETTRQEHQWSTVTVHSFKVHRISLLLH